MSDQMTTRPRKSVIDIIAIGFGQTVVMWGLGYVCRLSPTAIPSWLVLVLMLTCMLAGGVVAGRLTLRGWRGGSAVGALSAVLNMMILGSLLGGDRPNQIVPSALWWVPGSVLVGGVIGGLGAMFGGAVTRERPGRVNWLSALATTATAACLLLLTAGGLVTSKEAGLAVVDWPNSFGYNMFLYPLSRMTGGIYYEHTHRLLGSLLGLTVITLTICVWRSERGSGVRWLAVLVLLSVVIQGVFGGLRVTGRFTLSASRAEMAPSIRLAIVHGVLGQAIFAALTAITAVTFTRWATARPPVVSRFAATDRTLSVALPCLLILQLIFGAVLRHTYVGMPVHIAMAVIVGVLALALGLRAWGLYDAGQLRRLGIGLLVLTGVQVVLGVAALIATGALALRKPPPTTEVVLATAHQAVGAVLLGWAVLLLLWNRRLVSPMTSDPGEPPVQM